MSKKRMSAAKKEAMVLRLLRGEDLETVSRESGVPLHKLSQWRDAYAQGQVELIYMLSSGSTGIR